jgi:hypothetical protein
VAALTNPDDLTGELSATAAPLSNELQQQATQFQDKEERVEAANEAWEDFMESDLADEEAPIETLKSYILQMFQDSKSARLSADIDDRISCGRRLYRGEYTEEEKRLMPEIDVWFHLVAPLVNIGLAFLRSILNQADADNPIWELRASPIPELPEFVVSRAEDFAVLRIIEESRAPGPDGQVTPMTEERATEIVKELRDELFQMLDREAEKHTRNLQRQMHANLETADFYKVLDEFLQRLVVDPIAVMKGPVIGVKEVSEWKDGEKVYPKKKYQHMEVVPCENIYPTPDSKDPHSGTGLFEFCTMTRGQLQDARKMDGFVAENIDLVLTEFEFKSRDWLSPQYDIEMAALEDRVGRWRDYEGTDVIKYYGQVPGYILKKADVKTLDSKQIDDKDSYEVEVWMTCDQIIRAVYPDKGQKRPFEIASLYPVAGSFWGFAIPHRAQDEQRSANASLRAAIRDIGYTSGPISQVDVSFLDKNQSIPKRFHAGSTTLVNSRMRGAQGKAITFEQLTSQAPTFMGLINTFFVNAEINTGFNRQMLGQAQPGIGTLGEANILQANATTALRSMLVPIDDMLENVLNAVADQIMRTTEDPLLKADAKAKAKGSSHLLDRQLNRANLLQFFNTLAPISQTQPGLIEPYGMACLVRELASTHGQDPDKFVKDPDSVEARNEERLLRQQQLGIAQSGGGIAGGVSQPPATLSADTAQVPTQAA